MTRTCLFALMIALLATPAVLADPDQKKTTTDEITAAIERLDHADFQTREQATKALIEIGEPVHDPLAAAIADDKADRSDEFNQRANRILILTAPGGHVIDGLKICISTDKQELKPGDKATITTTLCNLSDKRMEVVTGFTASGQYFETGSALRRFEHAPGGNAAAQWKNPQWMLFVCGTGAAPMFKEIEPYSFVSFKMPIEYRPGQKQSIRRIAPAAVPVALPAPAAAVEAPAPAAAAAIAIPAPDEDQLPDAAGRAAAPNPRNQAGLFIGQHNHCMFKLEELGDTVRLKMTHRANKDTYLNRQPFGILPPQEIGPDGKIIQPKPKQHKLDPDMKYWVGEIDSNEIEIKLVR